MAKSTGLSQEFYVGGYDLSGDVGTIEQAATPRGVQEVTALNKAAVERLLLLGDGQITFRPWFNDATSQEHAALKGLPTADVHVLWAMGGAIGDAACALVSKQVNYDWAKSQDGAFQGSVQCLANGTPLEWGKLLTPGLRTDTGATNGSSLDNGGSSAAGAVCYLQVTEPPTADMTVTVEDSADNMSFATLVAFTQVTTSITAERVTVTGTVNQYVRVATTTSGGIGSADFIVMMRRGLAGDDEDLS